LWMVQILARYM